MKYETLVTLILGVTALGLEATLNAGGLAFIGIIVYAIVKENKTYGRTRD